MTKEYKEDSQVLKQRSPRVLKKNGDFALKYKKSLTFAKILDRTSVPFPLLEHMN